MSTHVPPPAGRRTPVGRLRPHPLEPGAYLDDALVSWTTFAGELVELDLAGALTAQATLYKLHGAACLAADAQRARAGAVGPEPPASIGEILSIARAPAVAGPAVIVQTVAPLAKPRHELTADERLSLAAKEALDAGDLEGARALLVSTRDE